MMKLPITYRVLEKYLSQNADGTCHTNLSNTHYSDLIVWDRSLFLRNWCNQFVLKSCHCALKENNQNDTCIHLKNRKGNL